MNPASRDGALGKEWPSIENAIKEIILDNLVNDGDVVNKNL